MSSVQERLQLKRVPLDKWSTSEQLYLASAVACSGDQNWMSVSRSLKMMCGSNRPSDWFSQKSCAAQYGKLLENVETPKRKKRNEKDTSQAIVETPSELILRKLTQERISELKKIIQEERDEYIKTKDEMQAIQNGLVDETQLHEMWTQIEAEEKQREKEQQKHAQSLKEREERKREIERTLRPNTQMFQHNSPSQSPTKTAQIKVKYEEMEVDDPNSRQGTSPLLTSLLKSPSPAPNPGTSILQNAINMTSTQARVAAPTITNLLTGSVTNLSSSVAAVTQQTNTKTISSSGASITTPFPLQLQTQPLTGPAPYEQLINNIPQSPSQAAPTLSMLLENKNKEGMQKLPPLARIEQQQSSQKNDVLKISEANETVEGPSKSSSNEVEFNIANAHIKDEEQQLMEVFNGLIPDNIDELADILTENNAIILSPELLEGESMLDNADELTDEVQTEDTNSATNDTRSDTKTNESNHFDNASATIAEQEIEDNKEEVKVHQNEESNLANAEEVLQMKMDIEFQEENSSRSSEPETSKISTLLKDDESSDLSNDTPLSELIKQESSAKAEQQKVAAEIIREELDTFESDSNDDKCLESIKREIQGLSGLKDNNSSENSSEALEENIAADTFMKVEQIEANENKLTEEKTQTEKLDVEKIESITEICHEKTEEEVTALESVSTKVKGEQEQSSKEDGEEKVEDEKSNLKCVGSEKIEILEEIEDLGEVVKPEEHEHEKIIELKEVVIDTEKGETNIEEKEPIECLEIVEIKDEDDNKEAVIVIEESEDKNLDESHPTSSAIILEDSIIEDTHVEEIVCDPKKELSPLEVVERKISTDDEIFEDAKEQIDDIKNNKAQQNVETVIGHQTIMIIDTDDDSPIEVIKEDKSGRMKRDYSRRKQDSTHSIDKRSEETTSSDDVISNVSSRLRLKDRDRSESPFIEEDSGEPAAKSKRRYSSTPNIDSLPNSPASSDDREYRGWKKSILLVYNGLITHRYASLFAKPITEDQAPNYKTIVLHPMDLQTLKRNIDSGNIRTTIEFQRYVMIMCYNAIFYNVNDDITCSRSKEMLNDALSLIEDIMDTWKKENEKSVSVASSSSSATKVIRGRKSNRLMN